MADALYSGMRTLPGGSSLARLLAERRGVRNPKQLPRFTRRQILEWADAHHRRTGKRPTAHAGPIAEAAGETWLAIATALYDGVRGQPGGTTLATLLLRHRGVRRNRNLPRLSARRILEWADAHHRRTGLWPNTQSGPVVESPEENWRQIDGALRSGARGLRGASSLAALLSNVRAVCNRNYPGRLSIPQVLRWADAHRARTGCWPTGRSGAVPEAPAETWARINGALQAGRRGLPGGSSVAPLLQTRRGARNRMNLARLTERQILKWADQHVARHGQWPRSSSGPQLAAPGETWVNINAALHAGRRGLPGGDSLAGLLSRKRGARNIMHPPPLTEGQIQIWARRYRHRTGAWPDPDSGVVPGTPGETWAIIAGALQKGRRGLPGGSSLRRLVRKLERTSRR